MVTLLSSLKVLFKALSITPVSSLRSLSPVFEAQPAGYESLPLFDLERTYPAAHDVS